MEIGFAADGGHADAIAIAADARDDARDKRFRFRMLRIAETQRIEVGDRPCAHREHIAQNAADACRCALIRLDIGRVVVAFDLEDRREAVADIDDARVFAGAADDMRRLWSAIACSHTRVDL